MERKLGLKKTQYLDVKSLPPQVKAKILKYEFRPDKYNRECLYLTLETIDNKRLVQKFTQSAWEALYYVFSRTGFENLQTNYHVWKLQRIGKSQQPRLLPAQP